MNVNGSDKKVKQNITKQKLTSDSDLIRDLDSVEVSILHYTDPRGAVGL